MKNLNRAISLDIAFFVQFTLFMIAYHASAGTILPTYTDEFVSCLDFHSMAFFPSFSFLIVSFTLVLTYISK